MPSSAPNIALLSGEMSGDLVGGALAEALRARRPDLRLWGMGSRHMGGAGVELLFDSAAWSAIGVVEALKIYPGIRFTAFPHVLREIAARRPAAVVLIDFGAFNVKVARWCKARGVPVVWYFPPGSWRRTGRANAELARITDRVATPFPWSEERLRALGVNVEFVGHPLRELARPAMTRAQFAERFGMEPGAPIVGLLPGSRSFEVEYNTPAMLGAAHLIHGEMPDAQFILGAASARVRARVEAMLTDREQTVGRITSMAGTASAAPAERTRQRREDARQLVTPEGIVVPADALRERAASRAGGAARTEGFDIPPIVIAEDLTYDVMAHADALLVCSGTATLEAALLGTPMVILYRGSQLMELEAKLRRIRPEHIGMPNIIAGRRIVPELIQHEASPQALAEAALRLLRDPAARAQAKADLEAVRAALGGDEGSASERTAEIVLETARLS